MINIFVLSYNNLNKYINSNTYKELLDNTNVTIVDNGNQSPINIGIKLTKNIGCAGGWNFICKLAFDYLNLDKIVISQDDVNISFNEVKQAYDETSGLMITGLFAPFFEFSTFVITKEVWNKIGSFDENFQYVYSEDADYKQRCMLLGVILNSTMIDPKNRNKSISIKNNSSINKIKENRAYLLTKWGFSMHPSMAARNDFQPPFEYTNPFDMKELDINFIPNINIPNKHPSTEEIENYVRNRR